MSSKLFIQVLDKDNKIVQSKVQPFNTFTQNAIKHIAPAFLGRTSVPDLYPQNFTSTTGVTFSVSSNTMWWHADPVTSLLTTVNDPVMKGIVVGTGTAAFSYTDIALDSIIQHGTSPGQLTYGGTVATHDYSNSITTTTREFINNSGNSITVNEIGMYASSVLTNVLTNVNLVIRDLIPGGISVANEGILKVTYVFDNSTSKLIKNFSGWIAGHFQTSAATGTRGDGALTLSIQAGGEFVPQHDVLIAGIDNSGGGLVVGTGTTPQEGNTQARISHGSGTGELEYGNSNVVVPYIDGNFVYFGVERAFLNLSGDSISVTEIALIGNVASAGVTNQRMFYHEILSEAINISNNQGIRIKFLFKIQIA